MSVCRKILVGETGLGMQVLGRNLEGMVTRAQEFKSKWKDEFVSVEHLLQALAEDQRFGQNLLKNANIDMKGLEMAIKDVRGSNRVTDQVGRTAYKLVHSLLRILPGRGNAWPCLWGLIAMHHHTEGACLALGPRLTCS